VVPYLVAGNKIVGALATGPADPLEITSSDCGNGFVVDAAAGDASIAISDNVYVGPGGWVTATTGQLSVTAGKDLAIADGAYLNGTKVGVGGVAGFSNVHTIPYLVDGAVIGGTGANDVSVLDCANGFVVKAGASVTLNADITVLANGEIVIEAGATLTINAGKTLTMNDALTNNGTLVINGRFINPSAVNNSVTGTIINNNYFDNDNGTLTNAGMIINVRGSAIGADFILDGDPSGGGVITLEIGSMYGSTRVQSGNIPGGCSVYLRDGSSIGTARGAQALPADCSNGFVIEAGANVTMYDDVIVTGTSTVQIGAGATLTIADGKALILDHQVTFNNSGAVIGQYDAAASGIVAMAPGVTVTSGTLNAVTVTIDNFNANANYNTAAGLGVNIVPYLVNA
ncbi:MAG: hypothetical protein EBZ77_16695, partial [Chitinophagia bacterium]|nr:hypothetical protein [Chitinophagia bacterium]